MHELQRGLLRSLEAVEAKAAAAASPTLRQAYLDLADHYRSRLKQVPRLA